MLTPFFKVLSLSDYTKLSKKDFSHIFAVFFVDAELNLTYSENSRNFTYTDNLPNETVKLHIF